MTSQRRWAAVLAVALLLVVLAPAHGRAAGAAAMATPAITAIDLPGLGTAEESGWRPVKINERGQIAGMSTEGGRQVPVLWDGGAVTRLLPANDSGTVLDLSNRGQVVGTWSGNRAEVFLGVPFSWRDGVPIRLVADPAAEFPENGLAAAVNDNGDVLVAPRLAVWRDGQPIVEATRTLLPTNAAGEVMNERGDMVGDYGWDEASLRISRPSGRFAGR